MTLGETITTTRKKKGLSQNALGKKIGTSGDIIGRYERDEVKPSIEVATKIADTLEISVDFLVGKTNVQLDKTIVSRVVEIQSLIKNDKEHILFTIDALLRDAKARQAYA